MNLTARAAALRTRIETAARRAGRDPGDVVLIGVSKTFSSAACRAAVEAGVVDLGENRAQELKQKAGAVDGRVRWHFIGHLQTNKVRSVVGLSVVIHSVDRMDLADGIARRASAMGLTQKVLIQVNVARDESKHGVTPEDAIDFCAAVERFDGISVGGLMTMPPYPSHPEDSRPVYKELAALRTALVDVLPGARGLSMGMTRDFEVAVEEGATFIRVGEALFGPRTEA